MFNGQMLAHVIHQLPIRRLFVGETALNRALAHRQLRGHVGEGGYRASETRAKECEDTSADAAARGELVQATARVALEHFKQRGVGGDERRGEPDAAIHDSISGLPEADDGSQNAEMLADRRGSLVAEDDFDRIEWRRGESLERDDDAGAQCLHHLSRVAVQIAVEPLDGTESAGRSASAFVDVHLEPVVEERCIARQPVERLTGGSARQHHVADDTECTGVVRLSGVETDVGIASELHGKRPQPLHERRRDARVGSLDHRRVDAGRAAYIRAWMALALEEAQKIDHQRGGQRRLTPHKTECIVTAASTSRSRVIVGGASMVAATVLFAAVFTYLAAEFDYPDVLARPAGDVLPALLALGDRGRLIWLVYGLIPLLLVPTAIGVNEVARATAPRLGRATSGWPS